MRGAFTGNIQRSIVKAITFRSVILCSDAVIILAITHRYDFALGVIVFSNLASTFLYFIHERIWHGIKWGKEKK